MAEPLTPPPTSPPAPLRPRLLMLQMLAKDARADINEALKMLSQGPPKKGGGSKTADGRAAWKSKRSALRRELGELRKEVQEREHKAVEEIMSQAQVVLCTNAGAAHRDVDLAGEFDLCVIDEAAMALEVSCWIPILKARKLVLAGDHCQLAPPIMSKEAGVQGLGRTLFDRVLALYGSSCMRMLSVQYRMHNDISTWCSEAMYDAQLVSADCVAGHTLAQLPGVSESEETLAPLCVVDTAGCDMGEEQDEVGSSLNHGEALVVEEYLARLVGSGVCEHSIGILTPYSAQVGLLRQLLKGRFAQVEIGTVDGFQGREKEAILLSLVRSNSRREVGFLADDRRLNVAVTRCKIHSAILVTATFRRLNECCCHQVLSLHSCHITNPQPPTPRSLLPAHLLPASPALHQVPTPGTRHPAHPVTRQPISRCLPTPYGAGCNLNVCFAQGAAPRGHRLRFGNGEQA